MHNQDVKTFLSESIPLGTEVTVRGWVRSRRDSKAGFSFVAVYDGSCFDAIQAVIPGELENYASEVLKITTGCSVEVKGILSASEGKGQARELQAISFSVLGWIDDPDTYPIAKKRHTFADRQGRLKAEAVNPR